MQLQNEIESIRKGMQEFQNNTFFLANYIKCNLATRSRLGSLINETGILSDTGLRVLVDNEINDGVAHIGMGNGPTFATINI